MARWSKRPRLLQHVGPLVGSLLLHVVHDSVCQPRKNERCELKHKQLLDGGGLCQGHRQNPDESKVSYKCHADAF